MKIKNKKYRVSIFFIALMLTNIVLSGANSVSAFTVYEDGYEDNDDFWSAYPISPGPYYDLYQGDEDWFYVSIGVDEVIKVSITFDGSQNNMKLELYDDMEMMVDFSWTGDNNQYVAWISDVSQSVYIRIYGDDNEEAYDMNVEIFAKGAYDDDYEDNDDFSSASEIYPNIFNSLVNNDLDYYKINIDREFSISIYNTSFLIAQLYSDSYDCITNFTIENSYHLKLDWFPTYHGDYYILVYGLNLGDLYDMIFDYSDDWAEPNDDFIDAIHLDFEYHSGFIQKDIDWYEVWIEPNDIFEINLFYQTWDTWMNLELYDEYEGFLTSGDLNGDHSYLRWKNNDNYVRSFFIKITGDNIGYWYDIELKLIGDDVFEDNDYYDEASLLGSGYHDGMVQLDEDWYKVWIEPKGIFEIVLFYDTENNWMDLELYDDYEGLLTSGTQHGDSLIINWINGDQGMNFYIRILGDNNGNWYDLKLKIDTEEDNGGGGSDTGTDPFANIPGFPIEIVGIVFIISSLAVILSVNKKKHKK